MIVADHESTLDRVATHSVAQQSIGVVVIGRNEGERLEKCLNSLKDHYQCLVYVDSGSTDGSQALARSTGAELVELDMSTPFTAARARNAGAEKLLSTWPDIRYLQFVDGDCEICPNWLEQAITELDRRPDIAIISGRLRERFPEASIYNRLCDMEWNAPAGEVSACGGVHMARVTAFRETGGFQPALIAGEESELCVRLRRRGWKIWRLDSDMALHDAAMTTFLQWSKRATRTGHAYAEGAWMHGRSRERHCLREVLSIAFWGGGLPAISLACSAMAFPIGMLPLIGYPLLWMKIVRQTPGDATGRQLRASFIVLGKFPEFAGLCRFLWGRITGRRSTIIEHKASDPHHV
ncbi:MAG: glycosyltransferase family 2 protein [Steroidobacteraceae bacterium]